MAEMAPELISSPLIDPVVFAVMVEAVTMAPVVPETVKLAVSTAIPPSRLTRVVVVAPRPVTVARVEVLVKVMAPAEPVVVISVPAVKVRVPPWETVWVVVPLVAPAVQREPPETRQLEQPISPSAERVTGPVAEMPTVPLALGKVMVLLLVVGSVNARVGVTSSSVPPSKTRGDAPRIWAEEKVMLPVEVKPARPERISLSSIVTPLF